MRKTLVWGWRNACAFEFHKVILDYDSSIILNQILSSSYVKYVWIPHYTTWPSIRIKHVCSFFRAIPVSRDVCLRNFGWNSQVKLGTWIPSCVQIAPGSQCRNRNVNVFKLQEKPKRGIKGVVIKTGPYKCKCRHAPTKAAGFQLVPLVPFFKVCKWMAQASAIPVPSSDFCRICMAASACRGSEVATLVQWQCLKPLGWQRTVWV